MTYQTPVVLATFEAEAVLGDALGSFSSSCVF